MADEPLSPSDTLKYQQAMLGVAQKVERALSASSERRVNNVWEYTQSLVAVLVVVTTCVGVLALARTDTSSTRMPPEWWTIVGLVIGFYFGRVRPPAPAARSVTERERASDATTTKSTGQH